MKEQPLRIARLAGWIVPILCLIVFVLDALTPVGWAVCIAYIPLLYFAVEFTTASRVTQLVVMAGILTVVGSLLKPPMAPDPLPVLIANRMVTLVSLVVTGVMVHRLREAKRADAAVNQESHLRAKHAESAFLAAVVESSEDAIFGKALDGTIQSWNQGAEHLFGYRAAEIVGHSIMALIPEDRWAEEEKILKSIVNGMPIEHFETVRLHKSGRPIEVSITVSPIKDPAGNILGASKTVREIGAQKEMAAKLNTIIDSTVDGLITIDRLGCIETFNKSCQRIFAYSSEEVIGKNIRMLMPEPYHSEHDGYLSRFHATNDPHIIGTAGREVSGRRKDGSVFPMDLSVSRFQLAGQPHFCGIIRDNTEKQQSAAMLHAIIDSTVDGLITIDRQGKIETFNPSCQKLFGYTEPEVAGNNIKMLMPEPFHSEHDGYLSHFHHTGEGRIIGTSGREVRGRRKDGSVFPMDLSVSQFQLGGQPHFCGIIRDITDRKRAEAEAERYTRALVRSNQALDEFAYAASHDLKAPLRVIANASNWLQQDLGDLLTGENKENLELLRNRVRRMDKLLNDLLAYSRIGRKSDDSYSESLAGDVLLQDVIALIDPPPGFVVTVHGNLADVSVRRMPLQQIMMNLISNAIKHHDRETGTIEVNVQAGETMNTFTVRDDGPGIDPRFHARIFDMFQTLKPRDQVEGSGMGLAMVRKNIEVFGGTVKVESRGRGCTFRFTWPTNQPEVELTESVKNVGVHG